MSQITKNPLLQEIEENLDIRLKKFEEKWKDQYLPETFKTMLRTLKESATLQISSKINAALTAQKNQRNLGEFQNDFLKMFYELSHTPKLIAIPSVGKVFSEARFTDMIRQDALILLKEFAQYVGEKGIEFFGRPTPKANNSPTTHRTPESLKFNILPKEETQRLQREICLNVQKRRTAKELDTLIKNLNRNSLGIANQLRRLRLNLDEGEFKETYSYLCFFKTFLDIQIKAVQIKYEQQIIIEKIEAANSVAALLTFKTKFLGPLLDLTIRTNKLALKVDDIPSPNDLLWETFLKDQMTILIEKITTLKEKTPIKSSLPISPSKILDKEKIIAAIENFQDADELKTFIRKNISFPLSELMTELRDIRTNGRTVPDVYISRKDELEYIFYIANKKRKTLEKQRIEKSAVIGETPNPPIPGILQQQQQTLTQDQNNDAVPFKVIKTGVNLLVKRQAKSRFTVFKNNAAQKMLIWGGAAITALSLLTINIGFSNHGSDAQAETPTKNVKLTPPTLDKPEISEIIAPAPAPTPSIEAEKPTNVIESTPLPAPKLALNFKSNSIKPYHTKPATIGGIEMKRTTEETLKNLCSTYKYQTWVCANG